MEPKLKEFLLKKLIAIDFDGTLVEHRYPDIGPIVPYAFEGLHLLKNNGYDLLLWTVRIGVHLREAVDFCKEQNIEFYGVNENPEQKYWNGSPKAYAPLYIDDAALGCPLIVPEDGRRSYADWNKIIGWLYREGWVND